MGGRQVFAHRAWGHTQAKLEQQFVGDALFALRWIVTGHATDERLQVSRDRWKSRSGCPPPE